MTAAAAAIMLIELSKPRNTGYSVDMNTITKYMIPALVIASALPAFSQETQQSQEQTSPWSFSVTADFAFYPLSEYAAGGDHFAPITGIYSGLEGRITGHAYYTIPVPFSDNPLVKGNTVVFDNALEITPVSVMPQFSVSFTPAAFLNFTAGAKAATGWELFGIKGMGILDDASETYKSLTPFNNYYLEAYASGTFQFDTAALWAGDWHHIVLLANYKTSCIRLTGVHDGDVWIWQGTGNRANGWQYNANFVVGYQMPLMLSMIGLNAELTGHYSASDYSTVKYADYDGNFMTVNISPLAQLKFGTKDSLYIMLGFSSRRSYAESHTSKQTVTEPYLTYSGREWFFNRVALSYTHTF